MARMPGVTWVGERSPRNSMSRYDAVCLHTVVGYAPAHAAHFSTDARGKIYQSRDTRYRSAANLNGNHRIIAIENEDHGNAYGAWNVNDGHAVPAFTSAQIEAIAKICAWAHTTHGIPLVACPNSKPGSRGIAYHRQGIDGNWSGYDYGGRVSGGEIWTSSRGKVCPGDRRIAQIPQIIARARQLVNGDDDMPAPRDWTNADWEAFRQNAGWGFENPTNDLMYGTMIRETYEAVTEPLGDESTPGGGKSPRTAWGHAYGHVTDVRRTLLEPLGDKTTPGGGISPRTSWGRTYGRTGTILAIVRQAAAEGRALTAKEVQLIEAAVSEDAPDELTERLRSQDAE